MFQEKHRRDIVKVSKKQLFSLIYLGAVGSGIASLFYVIGVREIGITLSSIVANLEIPLGIVLAVVFLKEKLTAGFVKIAALILGGFFLLLIRDGIEISLRSSFFIAILVVFIGAIIWASATLVGKTLLNSRVSAVIVPFYRNLFGAMSALVIVAVSAVPIYSSFAILNAFDWFWILYTAIGVTGVGFLLYYYALGAIEVKKVSLFFTLSPVIAVMTGLFSGEVLSLWQWAGVGAILIGLAVLLKKPSKTVILEEENQPV